MRGRHRRSLERIEPADAGVVDEHVDRPRIGNGLRDAGRVGAGSTVQLVDSTGKIYGSTTAASDGTFTIAASAPLVDGTYSFQARATDTAGNVGPVGPTVALKILGSAVAVPSAPGLFSADNTGSPGYTNVRQPRITGTASPNTTVQIVGPTGIVYGSVASGSTGSYVVKTSSILADGTYVLHAVATDSSGNVSPPGPNFTLTVLTVIPASPTASTLLALDDSGTLGDAITNVRQPRLTATGAAGLTIRLLNSSNITVGSATVGSNGSATVQPSSPLADGTYVFRLVAVDLAGNLSPAGLPITLTVLGTIPPAPTGLSLLAIDDTGVANDGMTSVRRPRLVGSASRGGRVDWVGSNGVIVASSTVGTSGGTFQIRPPGALINGVYPVSFRLTDVAGNFGTLSPVFNLTIRAVAGDDFGDGKTDLAVFSTTDQTFTVQRPTTLATYSRQLGIAGRRPCPEGFLRQRAQRHRGLPAGDFELLRPRPRHERLPVDAVGGGRGRAGSGRLRWRRQGRFRGVPAGHQHLLCDDVGNRHSVLEDVRHRRGHPGPRPTTRATDGPTWRSIGPARGRSTRPTRSAGASGLRSWGRRGVSPSRRITKGSAGLISPSSSPSTSSFTILTTKGTVVKTFAIPGDVPVVGDYFGNGRADLAVFRPGTATFYATDLATGAFRAAQWGQPGRVKPVLGPLTTWFSFNGYPRTNAKVFSPAAAEIVAVPALVAVESPNTSEDFATPVVRRTFARVFQAASKFLN